MDGLPPMQEQSSKKRGCIDDIIDHMTAEFGGGYEGQYIQFLNGPPQPPATQVINTPPPTPQLPQTPWPAPPAVLSTSNLPGPTSAAPPGLSNAPPVYYPQSGELGMMDVGNGNFVVYQTKPAPEFGATQPVGFIHYPAPQTLSGLQQPPSAPQPPHLVDYSTNRPFNDHIQANGGCLIENVVGNWAPNRNGTYSPFGGLRGQDEPTSPISSGVQQQHVTLPSPVARSGQLADQQQSPLSAPPKKQRIVAEVKPMRPSYSDVLAKSPPLTPPPTAKAATKPVPNPQDIKTTKSEGGTKKTIQGKSSNNNGGKPHSTLKRQNSSGSEEALLEKVKIPLSRWSSAEDLNLAPPTRAQDQLKKEKKKKNYKSPTTSEREEVVGNVNSEAEIKFSRRKDSSPGPNLTTATPERSSSKTKTREERKGTANRSERTTQSARKVASKRSNQRSCRRRENNFGALMNKWKEQGSLYVMYMATWLLNLLWDVTAMSSSLLLHMFTDGCNKAVSWLNRIRAGLNGGNGKSERWWNVWWRNSWRWITWWKKEDEQQEQQRKFPKKPSVDAPPLPGSLTHNISLPTTGEEAMKRLLSCKGKDPYSILGVTSTCTDEEIKKYYKSQALLVHPDKNSQPGAEEAFKILVHAFDLIAEPDKRAAYNRYVAETNQVEQAWSELSDLLSQLHEKMEYAANTIRCNNCGKRHKRQMTDRPSYAARFCAQCKIHHSAKEGDMWAESKGWGGWWGVRYYACMEGSVYDITQWANCQGNTIQKVKPDSHSVQYRVLMGRAPQHNPPPEPDIEDLLNSLYSPNSAGGRSKKKSKKNK